METTNIAVNEHMVDDKDATPPLSHQEAQTPQSRTLKVLTLSTNKEGYRTGEAGYPLGKPRVKRTNTRLASKKRGESCRQEKLEVISSRKGAMDDKLREDTDFSKEEVSLSPVHNYTLNTVHLSLCSSCQVCAVPRVVKP